MKRALLGMALAISSTAVSTAGYSQMITTEERFQDLFVTAGYGAAYGAAFGGALLSFQPKPSQNLRYIAIGASVGFIAGSLIGTYAIFTPMVGSVEAAQEQALAMHASSPVSLSPIFDPDKGYAFSGVNAQWTVSRF